MTPRQDERDSPAPRTTYSPPQPEGLAPALLRNIRTLQERRSAAEREASLQDRIAEAITRFTGSMAFVALHVVLFGFWTLVNTGLLPILPKWDASFVILGTAAFTDGLTDEERRARWMEIVVLALAGVRSIDRAGRAET